MFDNRIKIYTCTYRPTFAYQDNSIYLVKNNWDDFGYKTTYYLIADLENERRMIDSIKIGCDKDINLDFYISKFGELPDGAFSLGQTENYYKSLQSLSDDYRKLFLKAMKDIAYDSDLRQKAQETDVFNYSLIRFLDLKTICEVFEPLAHGRSPSEALSFEYYFPKEYKCAEPIVFNLNYEKDLINTFAIVGSNGCGKTTFFKDVLHNIFIESDETKRITFLAAYNYGALSSVINISYTGFDNYYPDLDSQILEAIEINKELPKYQSFHFGNSSDKMSYCFNSMLTSSEKLEMVQRYFHLFDESSLFEEGLFDKLFNLTVFDDVSNKKDVVGEILQSFNELSSGQKFIFATTIQLASCITRNSLILIDEPENHLHPPLLSLFINVLSIIAKENNSMLIVATHSPIVLQEIFSNHIIIIRRSGNYISHSFVESETYGSSYGTILYNVFKNEVFKSGFYKKIEDFVNEGFSYDEIITKFNGRLGDYGRSILAILLNNKNEQD